MLCSRALLVFVITLSASPSGAQVQTGTATPDTILVNGRVFTGNETHPYAEALAIKGTQILAIGTSEEISSKAGPTTPRIDLAGRLVIPGINDSHTHFEADEVARRPDCACDGFPSFRDTESGRGAEVRRTPGRPRQSPASSGRI
jgi:predicted amidohydrolase YtcJ